MTLTSRFRFQSPQTATPAIGRRQIFKRLELRRLTERRPGGNILRRLGRNTRVLLPFRHSNDIIVHRSGTARSSAAVSGHERYIANRKSSDAAVTIESDGKVCPPRRGTIPMPGCTVPLGVFPSPARNDQVFDETKDPAITPFTIPYIVTRND